MKKLGRLNLFSILYGHLSRLFLCPNRLLYITSKPPGANIILDDNPIPKTNTLLQGIPVGNHKITLEYQGLGMIDKVVAEREGLTSEINFEFQPEKPKEIAAPPKKAPVPTAKPKEIIAPPKKAPVKEEKIQPPAAKPEPPKPPQPEPTPGMESLTRGLAHLEKSSMILQLQNFPKPSARPKREKVPTSIGVWPISKSSIQFCPFGLFESHRDRPKGPLSLKCALTFLATDQYKQPRVDLQKAIDLDPKTQLLLFYP
jgi:hypothetical protein